jgi:ParB family transcriptional regulator, chromosome partitioning protein
MDKKKKLGKGLEALIPRAETPQTEKDGTFSVPGGAMQIGIEKISPNPYQPRKDFNPEKLAELVNSIKENGVLEPVILRSAGDRYELIMGERRFRAATAAGLRTIPAIIREANDNEMLEIALIENLQREDLNSMEEAEGYKILIEKFSLTQEELAKKIGMDRATIANTLRLLNLPQEIRDCISKNTLTEGHGRAILSVENTVQQLALAKKVIKRGLSVRETEAMAKKVTESGSSGAESQKDIHILDLEEELMEFFGTKVRIKHRGKRGRIEVEYYSEDEFQRILEKLRRL